MPRRAVRTALPLPDLVVLVLQGGGALGAFQAGVYDALIELGIEFDWVAGISIGAVNAAIIAGNERDQAVGKMREFLEGVSSAPPSLPTPAPDWPRDRPEEHTSELQSLMRTSYSVLSLQQKTHTRNPN